jgi:hypothetical protein
MAAFARIIFALACVIAVVGAALLSAAPAVAKNSGMKRYVDAKYGFSFWYPGALAITVAAGNDDQSFPGGVAVETVQVGPAGGVALHVVNSPQSTITDEPNGHAAPIAQTKYFLDAALQIWMVASPEGPNAKTDGGAKAADMSKKTIGGLTMFPSGARFDTTIILLSKTRFVVVQDGGGSTFTNQLAQTVAPKGAKVAASALSAALLAEANASKKQ